MQRVEENGRMGKKREHEVCIRLSYSCMLNFIVRMGWQQSGNSIKRFIAC